MRKSIFKKIIASVLSLTLAFSLSGFVFGASHAPNGANVVPDNAKWTSFSVRDDLHTGVNTDWENSLLKAMDEDMAKLFGKYYVKPAKIETDTDMWDAKANSLAKVEEAGYPKDSETYQNYDTESTKIMDYQSWTHGMLTGTNNSSGCTLNCSDDIPGKGSTGGDGEYRDGSLVADNPYGLYIDMQKIPVEFNRYYTLDFEIATSLWSDKLHTRSTKHATFKAYDYQSPGGPGASFETVKIDGKDAAKDGSLDIKKSEGAYEYTHVQATFKIPDSTKWSSGKNKGAYTYMGIMITLGAFAVSHDKENFLTGKINVRNLKVLAGTQYRVNYYDGSTVKAGRYVNQGERASSYAMQRKGYTLNGYIDMATNSAYNFKSAVYKDLNLKAKWIVTPKPKKASFKVKSKKKRKATVTFGKNANAKGYQVKYSYSKKFKKKAKYKTKTKTTSNTKTYTIKSLKSSKLLYVKARAYNKDSCGNKKYGKWSKRKVCYIK